MHSSVGTDETETEVKSLDSIELPKIIPGNEVKAYEDWLILLFTQIHDSQGDLSPAIAQKFLEWFQHALYTYPLLAMNDHERLLQRFLIDSCIDFLFEEDLDQGRNLNFDFLMIFPIDALNESLIADFAEILYRSAMMDNYNYVELVKNSPKEAIMPFISEIIVSEADITFQTLASLIVSLYSDPSTKSQAISDYLGLVDRTLDMFDDYATRDSDSEGPEMSTYLSVTCFRLFHALNGLQNAIKVGSAVSPILLASIYAAVNKSGRILHDKQSATFLNLGTHAQIDEQLQLIAQAVEQRMEPVELTSSKSASKTPPFYFIDLSGTSLRRVLSASDQGKRTVSPYFLQKSSPSESQTFADQQTINDQKMINSQKTISGQNHGQNNDRVDDQAEQMEMNAPDFDPGIFARSPTSQTIVGVIRNIFCEIDPIPERIINRSNPDRALFNETRVSTIPGCLVLTLSEMRWDIDLDLLSPSSKVFELPYATITIFAPREIAASISPGAANVKDLYYFDFHTSFANVKFYPFSRNEMHALQAFFQGAIGMQPYNPEETHKIFFEKRLMELTQLANNYLGITETPGSRGINHSREEIDAFLDKLVDPKEGKMCDLEKLAHMCFGSLQDTDLVFHSLERRLAAETNQDVQRIILQILERLFEPFLLQQSQHLLSQLRMWIETPQFQMLKSQSQALSKANDQSKFNGQSNGQFQAKSEAGDSSLSMLTKSVAEKIQSAEGVRFFALDNINFNERFVAPSVHRSWLKNNYCADGNLTEAP